VQKKIRAGIQPRDITFAAGSIWVTDPIQSSVIRISPKTNRVVKTIRRVGVEPNGIAFARGRIWVGDYTGGALFRINPKTNKIVGKTTLPGADWITVGPDALWVSQEKVNAVARIDPATGAVIARVPVGANPLGSVFVGGDLWVPNIDDNTVSIVDTSTNTSRTVAGPPGAGAIGSLKGEAWVTSSTGNELWRMSPG
jgi:YVTN family beta-propeller protein